MSPSIDFETLTANSSSDSLYDHEPTTSKRGLIPEEIYTQLVLMWPIIWCFIVPPGLVANALNVRTFLRMGLDDGITVSFFVMALSDFGHLIMPAANIVFRFLYYLQRKHGAFFELGPRAWSSYIVNLSVLFNNLTSLITAFLAVQRCLCIAMPFHFKTMFTKARAWCIMGAFVFFVLIVQVAFKSGYVIKKMEAPGNRSHYNVHIFPHFKYILLYVNTIIFVSINLGCMALSLVSLVIMSWSLAASVRFRRDFRMSSEGKATDVAPGLTKDNKSLGEIAKQLKAEKQNSKERTAMVQVALLTMIYLLTNLPKMVFALCQAAIPGFQHKGLYGHLFSTSGAIRITFDYVNSAVNFLVYYKYNTRFGKLCFRKEETVQK